MAERKKAAPKKAAAKKTTRKPAKPKNTAWYARNVRAVPVSFRFSEETSGRRVELRPRGERGDLSKISKDELEDPIYLMNDNVLFETIPAEEAKKVITGQATNQQRSNPLLDMLRNELGETYEQDEVVVEKSNEEQAITVAKIEKTGPTNKQQQGEVIHRGMNVQRAAVPGTVDNPGTAIPDHVDPEHAADWVARNAEKEGVEGPDAGLGGFSFGGIDPVQRG